MKLGKFVLNLIFIVIFTYVLIFMRKYLQKQEIIITNSTKSIIHKLVSVNKLETAEMTITKIMEAEKELVDIIPSMSFDDMIQKWLFQDKMIFELKWKVVAWVDMQKLETGDIIKNIDWSTTITLPQTEIFDVIISENSKPYDRQIWILTKWNVEMETQIRNKAKKDMKAEAISWGILESAKENAIKNLKELLGNIDTKITIK